jgi:hypothetical protein
MDPFLEESGIIDDEELNNLDNDENIAVSERMKLGDK